MSQGDGVLAEEKWRAVTDQAEEFFKPRGRGALGMPDLTFVRSAQTTLRSVPWHPPNCGTILLSSKPETGLLAISGNVCFLTNRLKEDLMRVFLCAC
jgi:hypothetical protein